jgi:TolB-like protein/Tfp pilus assembly protein PilF
VRNESGIEAELKRALGDSFEIQRELSGGGMSRVFAVHDRRLERDIVLKVLLPGLTASVSAERFEREIKLAAHLQHPHIVPVLDAGHTHGGFPFYTMPLVRGESLRARMTRGAISSSDATAILLDVAKAMAHAHAEGVVHRDIKPENVLLSGNSAMVTDFGIAKALALSADAPSNGSLTQIGTAIGTPAYMAPEQVAGDPSVDHRADIYSWGVMAYELLAGKHPFTGRTTAQQLFAAHMSEKPAPFGRGELAEFVMRCLEKDRDRRPRTASDIVRALTSAPVSRTGSRHRFKAIWALAAATLLAIAAPSVWRMARSTSHGTGRNIAVLPFATVGSDSAHQYVADGLTDELATTLAKIPGLQVAARRSVFAFKGKTTTPAEIGQALGVHLLLDGTVRRAGDRVRVTAQLTDAENGLTLWSDAYDGNARDVFALQDSIAKAIGAALQLTLSPASQERLLSERTRSLEAHDLYLQGRFQASAHTEHGLRSSLPLFQRAAEIDPTYPLPWVGIADTYAWLADDYLPAREAYARAKEAINRAINLAPTLAEAYTVLGWIRYAHDWDLGAAQRALQQAIALDSSSAWAHSNYAFVLVALDRWDDALREMLRALALDPLSPSLSANLEWLYFVGRRYDQVITQHAVTQRLAPTYVFGDSWIGAAYRELGLYREAIAAYERAQTIHGDRPLPGLALSYARSGDSVRAREQLRRVLAFAKRHHEKPERIAQVYASLGDHDTAFQLLNRALDSRSNEMVWLKQHPAYDPLREDPRFTDIVRRVYDR